MVQHTTRKFVENEILPNIEDHFEAGTFDFNLIPQFGKLGFLGMNIPEGYGSAGMSNVAYGLMCQEMERGDLVGPAMPIVVELEVGPPSGDLEGQIVARMSQERVLTTVGETLFIDRGRADGVRVGNTFYVVEREDEVVDVKRSDPRLPPSVIGRLVVVRVDDYSATAVVTDAGRSIPVGSEILTRMN